MIVKYGARYGRNLAARYGPAMIKLIRNRAASRIQKFVRRRFKKRRRANPARVTRYAQRDLSVAVTYGFGATGVTLNTLYTKDVLDSISFDNTTIGGRSRNYVDINAIKFCVFLRANSDNNRPIVFHLAMITPMAESWSAAADPIFTSMTAVSNGTAAVPFDATEWTSFPHLRNCAMISAKSHKLYFHKKWVLHPG